MVIIRAAPFWKTIHVGERIINIKFLPAIDLRMRSRMLNVEIMIVMYIIVAYCCFMETMYASTPYNALSHITDFGTKNAGFDFWNMVQCQLLKRVPIL